MSLSLISGYNNDSEASDTEPEKDSCPAEKHATDVKKVTDIRSKLTVLAADKESVDNNKRERSPKRDGEKRKDRKHDDRRHSSSDDRRHSSSDDRKYSNRSRRSRSRDRDRRHDRHRYSDRHDDDRRGRDRDNKNNRDDRHGDRATSRDTRAEEEYLEYRRKRYGERMEWGKASEEALKDVKTDSTLPNAFGTTIAKQLAAQREKRKLLWSGTKKQGEGSVTKTVWGSGSIKNDESGEQTAKFLKLMGVKDVTAENVKNFKTDESVIRSSEVVDSFEEQYEKSRYLQHINKGVGLGLVQFNFKPPPPS